MQKFFVYLTFIPWFLYFVEIAKNFLKILSNTKVNKEWFKKNFFYLFRFDSIILFAIFIFFAKFYKDANQIMLVKILLFSAINLFLYINTLYEKHDNPNHVTPKDISTILIILLVILIPIIFYIATDQYTITYYILFAYSFFSCLIVMFSKAINDLIIKIVRRKNNDDK